ncbi:MAG: FAD-dependent oxidoreductase [Rhodospirillales bacterium]|nr:FAD-dependent oxidoreductase [Rhodospirillales bacterium]
MFIDARQIPADTAMDADICVVGAGAAGIALALELAGGRLRVILLESGGFDFDEATHDLTRAARQIGVRTDGIDENRLRYFGGTTGHWNGWTRPLDAIDFEPRPWVPHSGWPIARRDLDPFYPRAHEICEIAAPIYDPEYWLKKSGSDRYRPLNLDPGQFRNILYLLSPPTRFGQVYRDSLARADNIRVVLHSNALELVPDPPGGRIAEVRVGTLAGQRFRVAARAVVLAAGAIENARLMLNSDRIEPAGVGNRRDFVGRCFMQHPSVRSARLLPSDRRLPLDFYSESAIGGQVMIAVLQVTEEQQRKHAILNHNIHVYPMPYRWDGLIEASKKMARAARFIEFDEIAEDLRGVIADIDGVAAPLYLAFDKDKVLEFASLNYRPEQAPNFDSRVILSPERDALGLRRVIVDWRLSELDTRTVLVGHRLFAAAVARAGLGRVRSRINLGDLRWPYEAAYLHGGHHHYGTTRMADDPRRGVVDRDCRVHDVANLYIAGSSVFPTTGCANPTLTLVALAVRLAKKLDASLT